MKNFSLLIAIILSVNVYVSAQQNTPAGAGDSDLRDNNVRMRSNELERMKRDANKSNAGDNNVITDDIEKKYPEIKEDFEGMQLSQSKIIKAYKTGENIDYKTIEDMSEKIKEHAERLDSNLFTDVLKKEDDEETKDKESSETSVRDMIVELDNAIGDLITSKMFLNLRVVEIELAKKTRADLVRVIMASQTLNKKAGEMKK